MPRRDGTGPMGDGSMTGKGLGFCTGSKTAGYGAGFGRRLGYAFRSKFNRAFGMSGRTPKTQIELLQKQKDALEKHLDFVNNQSKEQ